MSMPSTPTAGGAQPARKVKSKSSTRIYIIATLVCCALLFLILFVGSGDEGGKWVLSARQSIAARSTLTVDLFEAQRVSEDVIVAGAIVGDSEEDVLEAAEAAGIEGAVAQYPLPRGGQFTENLISIETELTEPLGPDERLLSVPAAYAASLAGTLTPGDRVDVYVVGDSNAAVANLLMGDVEVVSVSLPEEQVNSVYQRQLSAAETGEQLTAAELLPAEPIPGVFTLRVPSDMVRNIAVAAEHANLVLAYRGSGAGFTEGTPIDLFSVLCAVTGPEGATPEEIAGLIDTDQVRLPASCLGG